MMTIFIPMLHRKFRGGRKGSEVTVSLPDWQHTAKALGKGLDTFSTRFKPSFYEIELAHENKTHRARIWLSEEDARILHSNLAEFVSICDTIDTNDGGAKPAPERPTKRTVAISRDGVTTIFDAAWLDIMRTQDDGSMYGNNSQG